MRTDLVARTLLLASLAVAASVGCTLDSEGRMEPDASVAGSGGSGGATTDASPDHETPDATTSDADCFWPDKKCDGKCVDFDDPQYGCDPDTCEPCPDRPRADAVCINYACKTECTVGFMDCNGNPLDGCETDTHTVENCGDCGDACAPPNAYGDCSSGDCLIGSCRPDYADCNNNPNDGCETYLRDINNCGGCGTICEVPAGTGTPSCATGVCRASNCDPGWEDCNLDPSDGCETSLMTTSNCGACGNECGFTGDHVGTWECNASGSTWACAIGACSANWGNCDHDPATGCPTYLETAVNHCGGCNAPCSNDNVNTRHCDGGECKPTCDQDYGDCNGPHDGSNDDGCETNISTDEDNCGACDNECNLPHANEVCQQGICGIQSCQSGWGDCTTAAGCETNLLEDASNCGSCNFVCDSTGGSPDCNNGNCNIDCEDGRGNCDNNVSNGCETVLNTVLNCGACGNVCSSTNGTPSCQSGSCQIACNSGYDNCDNNVSTGCETPLNTVVNCGTCGNVCNSTHGNPSCQSGSCQITCVSTYENCDGVVSNGCEVNTDTDPDHCGACDDSVCSTAHMATRTCSGGVCSGTCVIGFSDCNGDKGTDGCEVDTSSDTQNCGNCGTTCSTNHVPLVACVSSVCTGACQNGWGNCDGDLQDDGCETYLQNTVLNCGGCGNHCSSNHIPSPSCTGGVCDGTCEPGWADCNDTKLTDGCEQQIGASAAACEGCDSCADLYGDAVNHTEWTCSTTNTCALECNSDWLACDGNIDDGCESPTSKFTESDGECNCINAAACANGGECIANGPNAGRCRCNGTTCARGEWCIAGDTCGTQ